VAGPSSIRFLKNIKLLRIRHDLTQERVAELSGIDYKFYQALETGGRPNVTLSTLDRIAGVYGLTGDKLIGARLPGMTLLKKRKGHLT